VTPQSERAHPDQIANSAGGYSFPVDDWGRALRFLVLGTDGGTFYISEKDLTMQNAEVVIRLANGAEGRKLVDLIVDVSKNGRAPRQNPTLYALAACTASPDVNTRRAALAAIPVVCRTGTHLFIFARYVEQFRGWGRGLKRAIGQWYTEKPVGDVAFQAVKYRNREGWSHRDMLRLSHPKTSDPQRKALFDWVVRGATLPESLERDLDEWGLPGTVVGYEEAQVATTPSEWARLVTQYSLPWETLPDAALNSPEVWEALLPHMGYTALIRQLGRLSRIGLVAPMSSATKLVADRLADGDALRKARVHPLSVLVALATYAQGHGFRGASAWTPVPQVVAALDEAFYLAFGAIEPAGKRTLVALDVSGSMTMGQVANSPLAPFQAEGAMAMTVVRTEPEYFTMAFSGGFVSLPLTPKQRLDDVLRTMANMPFDRTDCAVPMVWAEHNRVPVDTFLIYTDSETWAGTIHPHQALERYRQKMGIPARLAVIGMTSNGFSIANSNDAGELDCVGFDTSTPQLLTEFSAGRL
jgi:60 kDa SS-A/Ro ribonucleoprotein